MADANEDVGWQVAGWLDDPRIDCVALNVLNEEATVTLMRDYDIVMDGTPISLTLTHTHPSSDGSVPDWADLRAYTRCVGIPLAIGAQLVAARQIPSPGVLSPELAFDPTTVLQMLEERQIRVHEREISRCQPLHEKQAMVQL